jgi:pimeloyl-ACP methyl ester carboxylesterase
VTESESLELPSGLVVEVQRSGDGSPLVFLHAAGGLQPGDPFVAALAERFSLFAPVAPGFHDLAELDDIDDVHDLALHYDDLFEALGLDHVPVVGHSYGGMVAAELAAHAPHRVSRLVLIAPVGLWSDDHPVADVFATPLTEVNELLWGDPESPAAQMASAAFSAMGSGGNLDTVVDLLVEVVKGFTAAAKFMWPIPDKGLSKRLRRVSAPTLLVWGTKDRLVPPAYAGDFATRIADARVELIEGAGHMVPLERTDELVKLVDGFVS